MNQLVEVMILQTEDIILKQRQAQPSAHAGFFTCDARKNSSLTLLEKEFTFLFGNFTSFSCPYRLLENFKLRSVHLLVDLN